MSTHASGRAAGAQGARWRSHRGIPAARRAASPPPPPPPSFSYLRLVKVATGTVVQVAVRTRPPNLLERVLQLLGRAEESGAPVVPAGLGGYRNDAGGGGEGGRQGGGCREEEPHLERPGWGMGVGAARGRPRPGRWRARRWMVIHATLEGGSGAHARGVAARPRQGPRWPAARERPRPGRAGYPRTCGGRLLLKAPRAGAAAAGRGGPLVGEKSELRLPARARPATPARAGVCSVPPPSSLQPHAQLARLAPRSLS